MGLYDEFRFKPAPWLPHSELPLEELERVRNIKREDMEYTNENGYSVKVVIDPTLHNQEFRDLVTERLKSDDVSVIVARRSCVLQMKKLAKAAQK